MNQNNYILYEITIAGLLHDIGKFAQRAGIFPTPEVKRMESMLCKPQSGGWYSHRHVLHTFDFIEHYVKLPQGLNIENIRNWASHHHNPDQQDPLQFIFQQADHYSAGMDRSKESLSDVQDEISGGKQFLKERLIPSYSRIVLGEQKKEYIYEGYRYKIAPLSMDAENLFPKKLNELKPPHGELLNQSYAILWNEFIEAFKTLPVDYGPEHYINALTSLLERYTWSIPGSTIDLPDISLFDHSRTTAAIAVCLYKYHKEFNSINWEALHNKEEKKFLLIGGDLSGIQKYLYTLSHTNTRGTAKILRARSFYIEILGRVTVHKILHSLELPLICILLDAGGRFTLLAPNTENTISSLSKLQKEIDDWYLKTFLGELSMNISWSTNLAGEDFQQEKFPKILQKFQYAIEESKLKKMNTALFFDDKWNSESFLLDHEYKSYEQGTCALCEKHPVVIKSREEERELKICKICDEHRRIGKTLLEAKGIGFSRTGSREGEEISFYNDTCFVSIINKITKPDKNYYLQEQFYTDKDVSPLFPVRFLSNYVPTIRKEDVKFYKELECYDEDAELGNACSFEQIAAHACYRNDSENWKGTNFLGILRADVDNLGFIFSYGLGARQSISRFVSMSRMTQIFFSGFLQHFVEISEPYRNIYTVYAGGDDMFLVSDWETILAFAQEFREKFRDYTCRNPDITISAGISLAKPKFPIRRAAEIAEDELEKAKDSGKNRITCFLTTVQWEDLQKLMQFKQFLMDHMDRNKCPDSKINNSFLYRLLRYHRMAENVFKEKEIDPYYFRFHSLMAYDIGRNFLKHGKTENETVAEEVKELKRLYDLDGKDNSLMLNLKIPLFWTMYHFRNS